MTPRAPYRSRAGMTLVELLAALVVCGLALAAGTAALASVLDHRERVTAATAATTEAAAIRRSLIAWIAGARVAPGEEGGSFQGMDAEHRGAPDDDLLFLTGAPNPLGGPALVRLYVDRDPRTSERGLVAELWEWRGTRTQRVAVEARVAGVEARYLTGITGERRWLPSWISDRALPAAVELRLVAAEPDTLPALLRLPITVPLGGGR